MVFFSFLIGEFRAAKQLLVGLCSRKDGSLVVDAAQRIGGGDSLRNEEKEARLRWGFRLKKGWLEIRFLKISLSTPAFR